MKVHSLIQGSPEWLAYRAQHFNASDAPAMMGCSPYKTRAELLRELHTGVAAEVDVATQKRFDNGHRAEALARPLAEEFIGEDLYPVTGSEGRLSASFDGLTLDETNGFEHKALNETLRAAFKAMEALPPLDDATACRLLPLYHRVQMEQQLLVSGAERILFMASQWTESGDLVEEHDVWYYPDLTLRQQIIGGWAQFERDLSAYAPPTIAEPAPVGKTPESLPALLIQVTGAVTASNLAEFKATALGAIRSVNRDLKTDADFADADKAVKWCADVESRIKAAKEHAQAQAADIDALFKTLDDITAEARAVRLDLDKLVKRRKDEVREHAVVAAGAALAKHIAALNAEIAPMRLQPVAADFAGAIKGLRSIASMQDALDTTLATAKIAADAQARGIRANVAAFEALALAEDFGFLFADLHQLVHKAVDDFGAVVRARIAEHKAAEADKEAKRKADEEARIAAAAEQARRNEEARQQALQRQQAEDAARAAAKSDQAITTTALPTAAPAIAPAPVAAATGPAAAPVTHRADDPATLKLGDICGRLGLTMTAAFVADTLNVKPTKVEGVTRLYTEGQFARICAALASHSRAMATLYAGEPA